jgi:hypothetical protein
MPGEEHANRRLRPLDDAQTRAERSRFNLTGRRDNFLAPRTANASLSAARIPARPPGLRLPVLIAHHWRKRATIAPRAPSRNAKSFDISVFPPIAR